ncbi:MAG: helix-turn-helix domain-containing protein [Achromobacter sp.]|uniref:helix-turn-helix domain-containing protein n=1 Tax=Achromobacter sp. TaxID=134375 RepID=UPI003D00BB5E
MVSVASAPSDFSVFRTLSRSTATLQRAAPLGEGLAISQWSRSARETLGYETPGHHTLSLYLQGGDRSFRVGQDSLHGGAGKFCVLPAEHHSRWSMNDTVHFLHLYIAPERLAREAVMRLDCEPRTLELRDRTYIHDDSLIDVCRQLLGTDWAQPADRLAASSAGETVLHHLLNQGVARKAGAPVKGGLAPGARRRVMDYVDAHLAEPLTLDRLAGVAALSTYHFARMFHASFGEPPHAWVRARRLARARSLLETGKSDLAGIAQASGFGNASHLSRVFRDAIGVTPGQYRGARGRH